MKISIVALAGALICASAANAQSAQQASARNPAGLVKLLQGDGHSPTLGKDNTGDPKIDLELDGYKTAILFYDCDEDTHDACDSVQLRAGFDRATPWTPAEALEFAKKYRFASIWLDDEGDPWIQWDIITNEGIPAKVFLDSVDVFSDTLHDAADAVFEDD